MSLATQLLLFVGLFGLVFGAAWFALRAWQSHHERPGAGATPQAGATPARPSDQGGEQALAKHLRQAGLDLTPQTFRQRWLLASLGVAAVGFLMGGLTPGGVLFGGGLGMVTWRSRHAYLEMRRNQRLAEFLDQFTDALSMMANGVKSGQTVLQTFESIATDFSDPIRGEVTEVLQELRMGVPLDVALAAWAERIPLEELEIATTALIVQRQTGGNVAEILDTVAETIRQRNKLQKQIRTLTTQGRMSGWVLALLPVGLFVAMFLIAPDRTGLLLSHPIGMLMTALGAGMIAAGAYFIKRIVTIEV
ncbi:MAG: type II secretion system F family protein [Candidatus Sericytochromatia bacterium]|nr:type II secretion system F family protein [Candidatus Sericytochromatia bacterium]